MVETAFRERLADVGHGEPTEDPKEPASSEIAPSGAVIPDKSEVQNGIVTNESVAFRRGGPIAAKTVRLRDKDDRKYVSTQPCLVAGARLWTRIICASHSRGR